MKVAERERAAAPAREQAALDTATDSTEHTDLARDAQAADWIAMKACPRWDYCNAGVCVLAPGLGSRLKGESICFYLREAVKEGAAQRFEGHNDQHVYRAAVKVLADPSLLDSDVRRRLGMAAAAGSQIERGAQLAFAVEHVVREQVSMVSP